VQPFTAVGRGEGDTSISPNISEGRTVASGAGVTQALQAHGRQDSGGSAVPYSVLQIQEDIRAAQSDAKALLDDARTARACGDCDQANALMSEYREVQRRISEMQREMRVAEKGCASKTINIFFQDGQRTVQSVVSGTDAAPTPQAISEKGGETAAGALTEGAKAVMESPPEPSSNAMTAAEKLDIVKAVVEEDEESPSISPSAPEPTPSAPEAPDSPPEAPSEPVDGGSGS
jgi:hypothetical protein